MSWKKSNYEDENPFADPSDNGNMDQSNEVKVPLTSKQFIPSGEGETPLWLQDVNSSQKKNQQVTLLNPNATGNLTTSSSQPISSSSSPNIPGELDAAVPRMILYTRIINLALSVCMIIASLLSLLTTENATTGVLACYVMVFSCLLCCFETHLKQISKIIALNFGFLYSAKSRAVFMIFVGTILFSFSLFGKIVGCAMLVNACFNIFILFKYPQYEDAQRNDAQSEIKDYLASNPAFAKHVVKGAAEFVASNPEILKKGVENWASSTGGYSNV